MAAAAGGDAGAGIGTRLRAAREKKGLTVLQAAERMHVDSRILEALEAEDFTSLGAAVYARGHLRHYAELVDESPAELLELYSSSARAVPTQPDLTRISRVPPESDPGKSGGAAVIVVVTVAIVGTLWWFISSSGGEKPQPAVVQESTQSDVVGKSGASTQSAAAPTAEVPASNDAARSRAAAQATPERAPVVTADTSTRGTGAQVATPIRVAASPSNVTAVASRPATSVAVASGAAPGATGVTALTRPNPTPRPKESELTLKFSADSWVEVYDAAGQRLFYDVGAASSAHTVKGPAPLRVVLGNASGVTLEYNGRPASIPSGVSPDGSVRFVINARGRAVPATDGD